MILVANTQTNIYHLIANDRYEEYTITWYQGSSDDFLEHGVTEGWALIVDQEGNPL